jgi:hypothetical protein
MDVTKSVLSTVFIPARVEAHIFNTVTVYDPTGDVVEAAFKLPGVNPSAPDWKAATWFTTSLGRFFALCLVGPGPGAALDLPVGTYKMWLRITDNPEIPVIPVDGFVKIF